MPHSIAAHPISTNLQALRLTARGHALRDWALGALLVVTLTAAPTLERLWS